MQKNAALAEQASQPVKALHEQAVYLVDAVSFFRLGEREFGSEKEAADPVKQDVRFLQTQGSEALIAEAHKREQGRFVDRDLYLSVYSMQAQCVAHGTNARLVGVAGLNFEDVDGKRFVREIVSVAASKGDGKVTYRWLHPLTCSEPC
ncbi:cache domain-containing protein [Burkholderia cepacia]|uniref:cache domain-containing protein n=1 Tax=Burkholderia cepacia TaxID=292 RepID=UPI000754613A|nr:cache domain-containing protein [Burkholderia cepacia]KVK98253.1 hypothetical protein WS93_19515 [Burkholderia cepacia]